MERADVVVARFARHADADAAVKALAQSGFDLKRLSIVGRGCHSDESIVGFYKAGERIRFWGKYGALWSALWGLFSGGIFLTVPAIGPIIALGAVAAVMVSIVEGAIVGAGGCVLGAALYSIGIPQDSILEYEQTLKANGFLVFVHGNAAEIARARVVLAPIKPIHLNVHEGVAAVDNSAAQAQAAE
jgi:hypothetical protein